MSLNRFVWFCPLSSSLKCPKQWLWLCLPLLLVAMPHKSLIFTIVNMIFKQWTQYHYNSLLINAHNNDCGYGCLGFLGPCDANTFVSVGFHNDQILNVAVVGIFSENFDNANAPLSLIYTVTKLAVGQRFFVNICFVDTKLAAIFGKISKCGL